MSFFKVQSFAMLTLYASLLVMCLGIFRGQTSISLLLLLKENLTTMEKRVERLTLRNAFLKQEIEKLEKSPKHAKRVLRDRYNILDDNERAFFIPD